MSKLKLQATDGSAGTVSLKAPASTTGNAEFELTLPGSAGSNGQLLSTNGSGVLSWSDDNSGVSLSGSTNNTIATVTGANALVGEANLTFDGTSLGVGTASPSGASGTALEVNGGSGQARLVLKNDTTGSGSTDGHQIYSDGNTFGIQNREAGNLVFETNGGERLRIDSSGKILIGTTTAGLVNTADNLTIEDSATGGITIRSGSTSYGNLFFADSASGLGSYAGYVQYKHDGDELRLGVASNDRLTMDGSGDITIPNGNLKVASGHGIDFSATSDATGMTSELFDDYEEGLHTCTASPQNGTVTLLSGTNTLAYTKVGRIVHVGGTVKVDSVSNPSGDMQLSMPFTVNDLTEEGGRTAGASFVHNSTDGNNNQVWAVWINEGTNDIWLRMPGTSGSANKVQANTEFFISISYPT
jgi:hypothetical protein